MQTELLTAEDAAKMAVTAFDRIQKGARNAAMLLMTDPAERQCVLDGSQYAPSWRRLPEGDAVYRADENQMLDGELVEAFDETFEECVREWSGRHEETMGWHDGSLFVFGPKFDFELLD